MWQFFAHVTPQQLSYNNRPKLPRHFLLLLISHASQDCFRFSQGENIFPVMQEGFEIHLDETASQEFGRERFDREAGMMRAT